MKFNFEDDEEEGLQLNYNPYEKAKNDNILAKSNLNCISLPWINTHKEIQFCGTSKQGKIIIYQIHSDLTVKIISEVPVENKLA